MAHSTQSSERFCWALIALAGGLSLLALPGCGDATPTSLGRLEIDLSGPGWTLWLDEQAAWADDELQLPGVDVATLPSRPPTGGWEQLLSAGIPVSVPGTVEAYTWDERGDHRGVSWWRRELELPSAAAGRRVVLAFEAVRLRAEVFLDGRLVGHDAVGHTPFEVDISEHVRPGARQVLAVRVTDPGGNFDWIDHSVHFWGEQPIPPSHGFGGIIGGVRALVTDAVHVADVWVRNQPVPTEIEVEVTLRNASSAEAIRDLTLSIVELSTGIEVFAKRVPGLSLPPGETHVVQAVSVPDARLWDLDTPRLHACTARLTPVEGHSGEPAGDALSVRFGFRWFAPDGVGSDAMFRLNGRRVVLKSAISWGFWPVSGAVPGRELARRQVLAAKDLGLNMLNHHRGLAAPGLLDEHDVLGLLAHEEPGGYWCQGGDELTFALARAKWLRMVRRDRNHPSLVILNMINEASVEPDERMRRDLLDARVLDPTRTITFTSAWGDRFGAATGLHVRPFDETLHEQGWHDVHDAPGPGVDRDRFYVSTDEYRRHTDEREQIVFLGEEGAIGTPPRLKGLADEVAERDASGQPRGWDSSHWLERHDAIAHFLEQPGWREAFADVDAFTAALARVAYDFHGRAIENARLGDVVDGYVINGWEDQRFENHSGIVDVWRHPKGEAEHLARYLQPMRLAVKLPRRVLHGSAGAGAGRVFVHVDIHAINELGLSGSHELVVTWEVDGRERPLAELSRTVQLAGGDIFGEPLALGLRLSSTERIEGQRTSVRARLFAAGAAGVSRQQPLAEGAEEVFLVDWLLSPPPDGGALLTGSDLVGDFLHIVYGKQVPALADRRREGAATKPTTIVSDLSLREPGPLRWILVADVDPEPRVPVPREVLRPPSDLLSREAADGMSPDPRSSVTEASPVGAHESPPAEGETTGLLAEYFRRDDLTGQAVRQLEAGVDLDAPPEGPVPGVSGLEYGVRWSGSLVPRETGDHRLHVFSAGGVRLWLDDTLVLDAWQDDTKGTRSTQALALSKGRAVTLRLEHRHFGAHRRVTLHWSEPSQLSPGRDVARKLLRRVEHDGTTLLILDHTERWAAALDVDGALGFRGTLPMGRAWMGGGFVARPHPLLGGLVDEPQALGMPFQELVYYARVRDGLLLDNVETIIACVSDHQPRVGTALGVVRHGAGRIVLCTLDVPAALDTPPGPGGTARQLLAQMLAWAASTND